MSITKKKQHIGQVHQQRGELCDALKYFRNAYEIQTATKKQDHAAIAQTLNHIGNVYLQRGDAGQMVKAFSDSLRYLTLAGKSQDDLTIPGFNFYGLSKLHPECASVA